MSTVDFNLKQICKQRRLQMLFNIPPPRYNGVISPYNNYTKDQIDMRRKAEILQYNKGDTKSNKLTKKQLFSTMVKTGSDIKSQRQRYPDITLLQQDVKPDELNSEYYSASGEPYYITIKYPDYYTTITYPSIYDISYVRYYNHYTVSSNARLCNNTEDMVATPTSSSNVPGRVQYLYYDTNIPLYQYAINTNSFAIGDILVQPEWNYYNNNNVFVKDNLLTAIATLKINNSVQNYAYTYDIQTPVAFYIQDNIANDISLNKPIDLLCNATISSVSVDVQYNGYSVSLSKQPDISFNPNNIVFDISVNSSTANTSFFGKIFMGNVNISNLYLYTAAGYIYDIKLIVQINLTTPITYSSSFRNTVYGLICNTTLDGIDSSNCIFTTLPSSDINSGFLLSGS